MGDGEWSTIVGDTYRIEGARLQRAVWAWSGRRDVAEDAVAEAFAQLLRRGAEVRDPAAWVWRTAFSVARGALSADRMTSAVMPEIAAPVEGASVELSALFDALGELSPLQRQVVVLADYAGFGGPQVAAMVGSTPAAVRVHLHRARRRLRERLLAAGLTMEVFHA